LAGIGLVAIPAQAKKDGDQPTPEVFSAVVDCRSISDDAARLACFDAAVGKLADAQAAKEVMVLSSEEVRRTKRGLFGFVLPKFGLFGGDDDEDGIEPLKELTATIASFSGGTGRYVFTLDDGAVWEQTDGAYLKRPKAGSQIVIRRAALGSYMARVDDGIGFRIKRRN
jgi:hypothetical protein